MEGVLARLGWFVVGAIIVAYLIFIVLSSIVNAQASGINAPIPVRDELQANEHNLSGMVMVQSPCDELSVKTPEQISPDVYQLTFTTWREPSVTCPNDATPRAFQTVLFAPAAGIYFVATLDNVALPIAVIPVPVTPQ